MRSGWPARPPGVTTGGDAPTTPIVVDLSGLEGASADLSAVDGLARLGLAARRAGGRLRLVRPPGELAALLDLVGLSALVADEPATPAEPPEPPEPPLPKS